MEKLVDKTVNLNLVGVNGDAFHIMGVFRRHAKKEDWTEEEINTVLDEAMTGDYDHLLTTIDNHCEYKDDFDNENDTSHDN